MSRPRPRSGVPTSRSAASLRSHARLIPNAISLEIPPGPVPLLDGNSYAEIDEDGERQASRVMSRLHLKFSSSRAELTTQTAVVSVSVKPTGRHSPKDISIQADEGSQKEEIPTFEQWMGYQQKPPLTPSPRHFSTQTIKTTHTARPVHHWRRMQLASSPFSQRMVGSKVKDSPSTGAMFSPVKAVRAENHWGFLPTAVLKRHPELFRG